MQCLRAALILSLPALVSLWLTAQVFPLQLAHGHHPELDRPADESHHIVRAAAGAVQRGQQLGLLESSAMCYVWERCAVSASSAHPLPACYHLAVVGLCRELYSNSLAGIIPTSIGQLTRMNYLCAQQQAQRSAETAGAAGGVCNVLGARALCSVREQRSPCRCLLSHRCG